MNTTTASMRRLIDEFQVRGFVVLSNTLSKEQVFTFNRAIALSIPTWKDFLSLATNGQKAEVPLIKLGMYCRKRQILI
jgi:hypothetical protein